MSNKTDGIFYIDPVSAATLRAERAAALARAEQAEAEATRLKEVVGWAGEVLARHAGVDAEAGDVR